MLRKKRYESRNPSARAGSVESMYNLSPRLRMVKVRQRYSRPLRRWPFASTLASPASSMSERSASSFSITCGLPFES